jgi:Ricin-type beta-trefoil lectin domain
MMRGVRRLVVCATVTGLLVAGVVSASLEAAHADTVAANCEGDGANAYICPLDATLPSAGSITVNVTSGAVIENVDVNWTVTCADSTGSQSQAGATDNAPTPVTVPLMPLPPTADGQCTVNVRGSLAHIGPSSIAFNGVLSYTPAGTPSSPSASGPPVVPVKGYHGMCLDDKGNSSADRTKIIIWNCSSTDQAQSWKFSNNEFVHNGKCLNDQGNGGIRSHVILWSCNGASNEKWSELANGELKLQSHGGTLCLDDPRSSTTNGTQLIVYTCTDNANQKWALP